ncbi:bifunctional homocysteine S-methyltransferase/methylenetetrahydrofolate reductase [bacterium]|nr:bifunctional homocysteine S-methyltransferase/methylenetetrahydrofolate reductase [bacterium]
MLPFRERLRQGVMVCDGAMGTMLYARGIYINQCFDALNLHNADLIQQIHEEYIGAGAEIIETNTFGANLFKLAAYGLENQLEAINRRGVELAREVAAERAYVAGSIGPLGKPMAPLGKISVELAQSSFRRQVKALIAGGCDLLILETFTGLEEIKLAITEARKLTDLPIIAQMTFTDLGETLMGDTPERIALELSQKEIDVLGVNCSHGPAFILELIERIGPRTRLPLSAQPNAGMPRMVDGRFIYLSSPEYMAEYAKRLIQSGVSIVGGCCGSTPDHIRAMMSAVRALQPRRSCVQVQVPPDQNNHIQASICLEHKSPLAAKLGHQFVRVAELSPPRGTDPSRALEGARLLKEAGFDAVNVPDGPRATARMSPLALTHLIKENLDMQVILHYCCRDRNILGMQSDLLGMHALGVRNLLIITGDPPKLGDYPDATAVFDVDSIGLVNIVRGLNCGLDITRKTIGQPTQFLIAVGANPGAIRFDEEMRRLALKIENGAELVLTQPIFDLDRFDTFLEHIESFRVPVLMGLLPLASYRNAEFLHNEVPGMTVPEQVLSRLERAETKETAQQIGIEIARETLQAFRNRVAGVYIMPPLGRYRVAIDVVQDL